ncbi:hypothetical protein BC332_20818 [Capsicum chinense]|nr:hypothetical protein BC332_20818 [Capsicum chinense]
MNMVARGLKKHLKLDQWEFLMNSLPRVCGDDTRRSVAEALGLVLPDEGNLQLVNFTSYVATGNSRIYLAFLLNTKIPSNRLIYSIELTGMLPSTLDYRLTKHQDRTSTSLNYNIGFQNEGDEERSDEEIDLT